MSADGKMLFAANFYDDSVSIVDPVARAVTSETKLFTAGSTVARGEYPLWVYAARGTRWRNGQGLCYEYA